jgi:hypothetical protein
LINFLINQESFLLKQEIQDLNRKRSKHEPNIWRTSKEPNTEASMNQKLGKKEPSNGTSKEPNTWKKSKNQTLGTSKNQTMERKDQKFGTSMNQEMEQAKCQAKC